MERVRFKALCYVFSNSLKKNSEINPFDWVDSSIVY